MFTTWWFQPTPFEKYAQVKLDHATPRIRVKKNKKNILKFHHPSCFVFSVIGLDLLCLVSFLLIMCLAKEVTKRLLNGL